MRSKSLGRSGFTLVELLVVIGIIAVLIGILLPTLGRARAQAKVVQCQAQLRQIGQGIFIYAEVHKGVLPIGYWDGQEWNRNDTIPPLDQFPMPPGVAAGDRQTSWVLLVQATLNNKISATANVNGQTNLDAAKARLRDLFICPDAPEGENKASAQASTTYMGHPRLMPQWDANALAQPAGLPLLPNPYKLGKIRRAAEIALVFDGSVMFVSGAWQVRDGTPIANWIDGGRGVQQPQPSANTTGLYDNYQGTNLLPTDSIAMQVLNFSPTQMQHVNKDTLQNARNIRFRHHKDTLANALMADGHCESFTYDPKKPTDSKVVTTMQRKNINVNRP